MRCSLSQRKIARFAIVKRLCDRKLLILTVNYKTYFPGRHKHFQKYLLKKNRNNNPKKRNGKTSTRANEKMDVNMTLTEKIDANCESS